MSAEVYGPGKESAAAAHHHNRWVEYRRIFFDPSDPSQEQLQRDIEPALAMTVIREKLSIGMSLTARELMIFEGKKNRGVNYHWQDDVIVATGEEKGVYLRSRKVM